MSEQHHIEDKARCYEMSILYILSLICFVRIDFSEQHHMEGKARRDATRNPFQAKHINDSMFIEDLVI